MQVLITRPRPEAKALARAIEQRGHACLIEPMLVIEPLPAGELPLDRVQGIALTSANAVPALTEEARRLPVFAVGEATARAARARGCTKVAVAGGDASSLARLIIGRCRSADGPLLHLAGTEVRAGLAEALAAAGFELRRVPVYRARAATGLSPEVKEAFARGALGAVLLFSPRTAAILVELIRRAGLEGCLEGTAALCLSPAIAEPCRELAWKEVRSADRPDQGALLRLLDGTLRRW